MHNGKPQPNRKVNPTCAESRVECRQINPLAEKSSLHFLKVAAAPRFFGRESRILNENLLADARQW
jgi:hypothetical protein